MNLPPQAKIKSFIDGEVSEAISLVIQKEPEVWNSLQDHDSGVHILDREIYRMLIDRLRPHIRQLSFVESLVDMSGLLFQMRVEMRRRLGLWI